MLKYVMLLSYVGTSYCGWQKQKKSIAPSESLTREAKSIQATLEQALLRMTGETVSVVGSGRTDSGVHAVGQVAHFILKEKDWDPQILQRGFNGLLPRSIQVIALQKVAIDFHSQRSAQKKQYSFYFQQGPCSIPHLEPFTWWIRKKLDREGMNRGLSALIGEHNFKPFQASGAKPGPTVRKILEAEVSFEPFHFPVQAFSSAFEKKADLGLVRVRIIGTGFLKQMVRGIAGTLLQVGEGRRPPECFQEILQSQNRSLVGPTAPGRALWLERVWYPQEFTLSWDSDRLT